jgi:hypothetical protein
VAEPAPKDSKRCDVLSFLVPVLHGGRRVEDVAIRMVGNCETIAVLSQSLHNSTIGSLQKQASSCGKC